jgi:hypothetical protein
MCLLNPAGSFLRRRLPPRVEEQYRDCHHDGGRAFVPVCPIPAKSSRGSTYAANPAVPFCVRLVPFSPADYHLELANTAVAVIANTTACGNLLRSATIPSIWGSCSTDAGAGCPLRIQLVPFYAGDKPLQGDI